MKSTRAKDGKVNESVLRLEREADTVSVSITLGGRVYPVWFASSGEAIGSEVDFLLPLTLFPAMKADARLRLPGEVSPRLLSTVPKVQEIFLQWGAEYWGGNLEDLRRVWVDAEVRSGPTTRASGVGCFFSGGVDSFYTLLKHREEITHIIFVHGFDIALEEEALRAQASRMAREVAGDLGKTLIEVETNLRSFSDRLVGWEKYHGAAMASVALLFQHRFRKVLIATTNTYANLIPWGSHPMLDPLWSTELTEMECDGCEATRPNKVAYISEYELPMEWLRICHANPNGAYNCGRCEKCLRTMIDLRLAGALERCKTLPNTIDLEAVSNIRLPRVIQFFAKQRLEALERLGTEPDLARAYAEAINGSNPTVIELERTRAELEGYRRIAERSRARRRRLAQRNRVLTARISGRRYKVADAIVEGVLKIPGVGWLVRRKDTSPFK